MKKISLPALVLLIWAAAVSAALPDDILGIWNTSENEAKVEIYRCEGKFCGKIVWMKDPLYPDGSAEGPPGSPKVDHNNPDSLLRGRPVMNLEIMRNFSFDGNNTWKGGKLYDPEKGKTYSGKMTLISPDRLALRGYVGISWIGRTSLWTRAKANAE